MERGSLLVKKRRFSEGITLNGLTKAKHEGLNRKTPKVKAVKNK